MNQELLDYIKQAKESGLDDAQIRQSLLEQGWSDSDIDEVINKKDKRFSDKKKRPWIIPAIAVFVVLILAIGGLVYYFYFQDQPATQETVSCDLEQKEGNIIVRGKVVFPTGIRDKETYEVIGTNPESFSINSDGVFCAYAAQGRPILVSAVSDDENDFVLAAIVNSNGDISDFIINSKSTAVTLVFLNPLINPELLVDTIPNNPDVIKFADKINSLSDLTINDFEEGGRLYEDYDNAVISVLESLSPEMKITDCGETQFNLLDTNLNPEENSVLVCLGNHFLNNCQKAKAVINNDEIVIKGGNLTGCEIVSPATEGSIVDVNKIKQLAQGNNKKPEEYPGTIAGTILVIEAFVSIDTSD